MIPTRDGVAGSQKENSAQRQRFGAPHAEIVVDLPFAQAVGQGRHLGSSMTTVREEADGRAHTGSAGLPGGKAKAAAAAADAATGGGGKASR